MRATDSQNTLSKIDMRVNVGSTNKMDSGQIKEQNIIHTVIGIFIFKFDCTPDCYKKTV